MTQDRLARCRGLLKLSLEQIEQVLLITYGEYLYFLENCLQNDGYQPSYERCVQAQLLHFKLSSFRWYRNANANAQK